MGKAEGSVEDYLVKVVESLGGEARKIEWVQRRGAPDRLVLLPEGWLLFVETKAPGGRLAAHQKREHERLRNLDQVVLVLYTKEMIDQWFAKFRV